VTQISPQRLLEMKGFLLFSVWLDGMLMFGKVCNLKHLTDYTRGELSYLAPLGSENISAPYFKQCFFQGVGYYPPD